MVKNRVNPSRQMGFTPLYLDFLAGRRPARDLYRTPSPAEAAVLVDGRSYDRSRIVEILRRQNVALGAGQATRTNIERLADQKTVAVLAGQQAGLLGGPLYSLIKALALAKTAERYSTELKRSVVPIFWIAGDDHDFEEINHATVLNRAGELTEIRYSSTPKAAFPASQIYLSDQDILDKALSNLRESLGDSDFTPALYDMLRADYTTDDSFVTAFGKLMARLTEQWGVIFFDPGDADAKQLAAPFLLSLFDNQDQARQTLHSRNGELESAGYHVQVHKQENAVHLFYNNPARVPLWREGEDYVCGREKFDRTTIRNLIQQQPERFSPDALARPLMQSHLFPTVAQIGGPSELAYLAQVNPLFEVFRLPTPYYVARPSITLVEKRFEKLMDENGITFEDITGDIEQVVNRIMTKSFPPDLDQGLRALRSEVAERIANFTQSSLSFDPSLADFAKQTSGKVDFALNAFSEKVFAAHKRKDKETRDRIHRLGTALYPGHGLQERTLNVSYFIAKYGFGVVSFLYQNLGDDGSEHRIAHLARMEDQ